MSEFEFFFSFFGLLLGLTAVEVATKLADAIGARKRVAMGSLTPMLALFVLLDVSGLWMWVWSARDLLVVSWPTVLGGLVIALSYFLSAALVFPRVAGEWPSLDDYFDGHKTSVVAGIFTANALVLAFQLAHVLPAWNDYWFFIWQGVYYLPLAALGWVRSRRIARAILIWLLVYFALVATDALPSSAWGNAVGLNGSAAQAQPL